ncbi:MAG: hypothetical protein KQH63_12260 [Desulfobulbaceae bacterium]|nr:hypothetical protein [Desulfobulbaceae bacterium]
MDGPVLRYLHTIQILFFSILLALGGVITVHAESGSLFFAAIVENDNYGNPQTVLEWGALEGEIPTGITTFKLYRSTDNGDHLWLADIPYNLVGPDTLGNYVLGDLPFRSDALIENLSRMSVSEGRGEIDYFNFKLYLYNLLDPASPDYDRLKVMLLSRAHLSAARAQGLAYIDDDVSATSSYHYLLTAVTAAGESLPIGQSSTVDPSQETILPAPGGLVQVRLSECSALAGGLDDNTIHFSWDIPGGPQYMGFNALTYGYELFWSTADLGVLDFRDGIPAGVFRVNQEPVVVSGPAAGLGPDNYLAKDGPENHTEGPLWKPGQIYFYYLTARDITGHYSDSVAPVPLTVSDAMPPRAVWNAHTIEVKDPVDNTTPRLALVWDAPTSVNFARYYGGNRTLCSADDDEVCWVGSGESCTSDTLRCADLAVEHYRIFRFDSAQEAAEWGIDTDGDGWPDIREISGAERCNPNLHPSGTPPEWIKTIGADDPLTSRNLTETHRQIYDIDYDITADNHVYWYKIIAVDGQGNQSPLSPPLRGVLYDRSQPVPAATVSVQDCTYAADSAGDCGTALPEADDVYVLRDLTGDAASYKLMQVCGLNAGYGVAWNLLDSGEFDQDGLARIKNDKFPNTDCIATPCNGFSSFVVRFFDAGGRSLADTDVFIPKNTCVFQGCITLEKACEWLQADGSYSVAQEPVRVCVDLQTGQSARVYYQTTDGMSPFYTFPTAGTNGEACHDFTDLDGLTPADICLGVRVFSENHIGSIMANIGCFELHAKDNQPPPTPLLDAPEPIRNVDGDFFQLYWSMPAAGIGSYTLKVRGEDGTSYVSLWDRQPDASGRYPYLQPLAPEDIGKEWCFQLRALGTDMQASDWSLEQCGVWQLEEPENLPWPPVAEPELVAGESIGAFYMATDMDHRPVLVLSDDITPGIESITCQTSTPFCDMHTYGTVGDPGVSPCIRDNELVFYSCPACSVMEAQMAALHFIVYRQESGHDFIQISPLIEGFHCTTEFTTKNLPVYRLQDPFITLMEIDPEVVTGVSDPVAIGGGTRVLYKDRYPFKAGSQLRYKLVSINPLTGEPDKVFTSNWVVIP